MKKQPSHTPNLNGALADSKRIILASYPHYLALSIFFFPICATIASLILSVLNINLLKKLFSSNLDQKSVIYLIICIIFVYSITQCAIATMTYSTHHRVLGNPMSLLTVIKSLRCTFFPLFFTSLVAGMLLVLITLTFVVTFGLVLMLGQTLGFVNSFQDHVWFSLVLCVILGVTLGLTLHAILVKWSLAYVVVVAESKWGFSALKRSWHFSEDEGLRSLKRSKSLKVSKCDMLSAGISYFCGAVFGAAVYLIWSFNLMISDLSYILLTVFGSFFLMMVFVMVTVDNCVFYIYPKAAHDEMTVKVDDPAKDVNKVPDVINVVIA